MDARRQNGERAKLLACVKKTCACVYVRVVTAVGDASGNGGVPEHYTFVTQRRPHQKDYK